MVTCLRVARVLIAVARRDDPIRHRFGMLS
jgi:hypothetical protein